MPPNRGDTHSHNNGLVRGCFRARSLLLSSATPESEPPPFFLDYFFWASVLDLGGACGYVAADFMRGYFNAHPDASNMLYQILGVAFVIESLCFAMSWQQATYRVGCWPHMAAEYLNIVACLMYLSTACMYGYRGGFQDPQTIAIGNAVVSIELVAALLFTADSSLYWWTWCVDNLEAEEELVGVGAQEGRVCARHAWLCFRRNSCRNVEMQEHVWNVIPSLVYVTAAVVSVYLQTFIAHPPSVAPLPTINDTYAVPAATCYPNVAYALMSDSGPPCTNPRLFNAPCPVPVGDGSVTQCWEERAYAPGSLCAEPATDAWCVAAQWWTPPPRNSSTLVNSTQLCYRRGSYSLGDPCALPGLWPGLALDATQCSFLDSRSPETRPPCNDPGLWGVDENRTYVVVPRPRPPSIGELDALRYSARVYVVGDTLFALDAAIVLWAWWIYAEDRRREYKEHMLRGHGGDSSGSTMGGGSSSSASLDQEEEEEEVADDEEELAGVRPARRGGGRGILRLGAAAGDSGASPASGGGGGGSDDDAASVYSARSGVRRGRWAALGFAPTGLAKDRGGGVGALLSEGVAAAAVPSGRAASGASVARGECTPLLSSPAGPPPQLSASGGPGRSGGGLVSVAGVLGGRSAPSSPLARFARAGAGGTAALLGGLEGLSLGLVRSPSPASGVGGGGSGGSAGARGPVPTEISLADMSGPATTARVRN